MLMRPVLVTPLHICNKGLDNIPMNRILTHQIKNWDGMDNMEIPTFDLIFPLVDGMGDDRLAIQYPGEDWRSSIEDIYTNHHQKWEK